MSILFTVFLARLVRSRLLHLIAYNLCTISGDEDNDDNSGCPIGIPKVFDFGTVEKHKNYNAIIMEMLGLSLYDSFKKSSSTFALRSVVYISQQLVIFFS